MVVGPKTASEPARPPETSGSEADHDEPEEDSNSVMQQAFKDFWMNGQQKEEGEQKTDFGEKWRGSVTGKSIF